MVVAPQLVSPLFAFNKFREIVTRTKMLRKKVGNQSLGSSPALSRISPHMVLEEQNSGCNNEYSKRLLIAVIRSAIDRRMDRYQQIV